MNESVVENVHRNILLTPRDVVFLEKLYDHVVLSFRHVREMCFQNRDHSTIINRLRKLEKEGLIRKITVSKMRVPHLSGDIGVVYQIEAKGIRELIKWLPNTSRDAKLIRFNPNQLEHDLVLVNVHECLKLKFPNFDIKNTQRANLYQNDHGKQPDLVMFDPVAKTQVAVELELTCKSAERYREIVTGYRMNRHFQKVIFVTASDGLTQRIRMAVEKNDDPFFEFIPLNTLKEGAI